MVLLLITVAVAGATFAPQLTLQSAILDDMVTRERVGASFGWLTTALALGNAAGQTAGGAISHFAGPNAAAAVGAVTVAAAAVVVAIRRESLSAPSDPGADGALASL
jgi:predicted MFS family arabinose efflux permease